MSFSAIRDVVAAYANHHDERAAVSNRLALIIASNQPFYPLYVYLVSPALFTESLFTLFTTPLFLAIPAWTRRHPRSGRALVSLVGAGNTLICVAAYGPQSGVELFFMACAVMAALPFRADERRISYGLLVIIAVTHFAARYVFEVPGNPAIGEGLVTLHGYSVFGLLTLIAILFASIDSDRSGKPDRTPV